MLRGFESFVAGYADAMLWANAYREDPETGELAPELNLEPDDLPLDVRQVLAQDCLDFWFGRFDDDQPDRTVGDLVSELAVQSGYSFEQAGHDFALTRNGHGAGYWDRGLGELGDVLSESARVWGERNLFMDSGGVVYVE